jgi:hypothetical protein
LQKRNPTQVVITLLADLKNNSRSKKHLVQKRNPNQVEITPLANLKKYASSKKHLLQSEIQIK